MTTTVDGIRSLEDLALALRDLRAAAGHPSYAEIARRVAAARARRGVPDTERRVARATVFDCFRTDRRRVDVDLVVDVVRALDADEALAAAWAQACRVAQHRADAATVVTVRAGLPDGDPSFVGRRAELATLLDAGPAVLWVAGMPGSGKSTLAVRAAHTLVATGRVDRAVHVDLRGFHPDLPPADPAAVLEALLRTLDVPGRQVPSETRQRQELLVGRLRTRRHVLVLDDAADLAQVRPLLPDDGRTVVVVTSRVAPRDDAGPPVVHVPLDVFTPDEAVELLRGVVGEAAVDEDPAAARALVEAVGCHPLAVGVTATRAAARPTWTLADGVEALHARGRALRLDDGVATTLALSYAALSPAAARTLRALAVHPCPDLDLPAVAALVGEEGLTEARPDADTDADADAGAGPGTARDALEELVGHHLVTVPRPGRFGLHAVVRTFAHDRSLDEDRPRERAAALDRLGDHVLTTLRDAEAVCGARGAERGKRAGRFTDEASALTWLDDNVEVVLTLAHHAPLLERPLLAVELSEATAWWLLRYARFDAARRLHTVAVEAAGTDRVRAARARLALGQTLVRLGEPDAAAAHLTRAVAVLDEAGEHGGAAAGLNALAILDVHRRALDRAAERFGEAVERYRSAGDRRGVAAGLDNVAIVHRRAGRLGDAVATHRAALAEAERLGDGHLQATTLTNLVEVLVLLGEPAEALRCARQALTMARDLDNPVLVAFATDNLGTALAATGDHDGAVAHHTEALRLARDLADRHLEAAVLNNLGADAVRAGEPALARSWYEQAHALASQVGDSFERARAADGLGVVLAAQGAPDEARARWSEALDLFDELGAPEAATTRGRLGRPG